LGALKRVSKARGRARAFQNSKFVQQNETSLMQYNQGQTNTNFECHNHSSSIDSQVNRLTSSPPDSNKLHMNQPSISSQSVVENKSQNRYSQESKLPNGGFSSTNNPKNRVLGRSKFSAPAMRSLNKAMDVAGTPHHKSNRPSGGQRCFNFSYKEPESLPSKPIELAIQHLSDGKHILEEGFDGQVDYISGFYPKNKADKLYHMLLGTLNFEAPSKKRGDEIIKQPRLSVWFGPKDLPYSYSYVTLQAHEFSSNSIMAHIKADVESRFGVTFNSCLVNLYRDNKDGVGWHADDEKSLGYKPTIASLSFGDTRRFEFCHKSDKLRRPIFGFHLEHGSGLLMKGDVQERWLHCVPREYHDRKPRLNLTFRTIYETM
jgi:alkylated DNA repair dioxygenase AlkB